MAQRTSKNKKKNQLPNEKQLATTNYPPPPNLWPNLPHKLINIISKQPNLMQNITSFGGVTKSWKPPSRHFNCNTNTDDPVIKWAQLVEINGKKQQKTRSHFVEISFQYTRKKSPKNRCPGICFKGHSHGHVVVIGKDTSSCYIWDPAGGGNMVLPPWDTNLSFKICTLSSSPKGANSFNVMVLTGTKSPAFAFYRWGKISSNNRREWIIQECYIKEPYAPGKNMIITNGIGFGGKFYALSSQGSVVVIEDVDSCFKMTRVGARRSVPSGVSMRFREYLVESDGEILLVFLVSRQCVDVVEDVEVFRLDIDRLLWVKIVNIGDRALFLEDECCMVVDARKVGYKKNCVYFAYHRVDMWWVFDMESGKILPAENVIMY
ncbi:hypothetical protein ABFX02_14G103200 [Erythranthe guttata]